MPLFTSRQRVRTYHKQTLNSTPPPSPAHLKARRPKKTQEDAKPTQRKARSPNPTQQPKPIQQEHKPQTTSQRERERTSTGGGSSGATAAAAAGVAAAEAEDEDNVRTSALLWIPPRRGPVDPPTRRERDDARHDARHHMDMEATDMTLTREKKTLFRVE